MGKQLSDKQILEGFRQGDSAIIREYFYGYCRTGYYLFDQRYQLSDKENLDFMSLAHQYALYLMEHNWKPLDNRSDNVSLKTWLINGFRFVVLDALDIPKNWLAFVYAIPADAIVMLSLRSAWKDFRWNRALISVIMWGGLLSIYMTLLVFVHINLWKMFLLGIPGQLAILLWSGLFRQERGETNHG